MKKVQLKKIFGDPVAPQTQEAPRDSLASDSKPAMHDDEDMLEPFLGNDPANDDDRANAIAAAALLNAKFTSAPSASLTFFFAGTIVSLTIALGIMSCLQYGITINPVSILTGVISLVGFGFIGYLLMQYNTLLAEHRKSEMLRLHPARVMEASRALSQEVAALETRVSNFSNFVVEASDQFQSEAAQISKGFVNGQENFHKAFESWLGEARTLSTLYDDTLNQINAAQKQIQNSVARFPRETTKNVENIITTLDDNIDLVVRNLKHRLETDLKFSQLSEMMTEMARVVETLFTNFEEIFVQKLNEIQPHIVNSMAVVSDNVENALGQSTDRISDQLNQVSKTIKDYNDEFLYKFNAKMSETSADSYKALNHLSEAITSSNLTILEGIKAEKAEFEVISNTAIGEFKSYIADMSNDIKSVTSQTETDLDEFLGKFNFNFREKLKYFSELIDSKSHVVGDQFLVEVDNLKQNFAELAETFAQVIQATVNSFDVRAERTTEDIERHLGVMISKSISSITMRLDLFEEQVLSRLGKSGSTVPDRYEYQPKPRRQTQETRYNNDYLSILEQQMHELQQSLTDMKRDRNVA